MKPHAWRNHFQACPETVFSSRGDPRDLRLGDRRGVDAETADFRLWGYPDDEGIALNGGRLGAAEAPLAIRESLFKLTFPSDQKKVWTLCDAGQLDVTEPLPQRHEKARQMAAHWTRKNSPWMSLGGGHDYGYSDGAGFVEACLERGERPVILNFDAHLDVRPLDRGLSSGTPFFRILEEFKGEFDFFEIGIQPQCSSRAHAEYVLARGGQILFLNSLLERGLLLSLQSALRHLQGRPTFLSVDIDAFASSEALGCSQSWPTGLSVREFLPSLTWLQEHLQIKSLGLYEVSPGLDLGLQTQKLAALILYEFMRNSFPNSSSP